MTDNEVRNGKDISEASRLIGLFLDDVQHEFTQLSDANAASNLQLRITDPFCDTLQRAGEVVIIADMPGADRKSIHILNQGNKITVSGGAGERWYKKTIMLDPNVRIGQKSRSAFFNNGVLEITFDRQA